MSTDPRTGRVCCLRAARPSVQVPRRVSEHRHHNGEPKEKRDRPEYQGAGDNKSPCHHYHRVRRHRSNRRADRHRSANVLIEQHRERYNRERQHHHGEDRSDSAADNYQGPTGLGGENLVHEAPKRRWRCAAEGQVENEECRAQPGEVKNHHHDAEGDNGANGRRPVDCEGLFYREIEALLAPPAYFIEANRGEGSDQGKAGNDR